jgi:hypothetical protein
MPVAPAWAPDPAPVLMLNWLVLLIPDQYHSDPVVAPEVVATSLVLVKSLLNTSVLNPAPDAGDGAASPPARWRMLAMPSDRPVK